MALAHDALEASSYGMLSDFEATALGKFLFAWPSVRGVKLPLHVHLFEFNLERVLHFDVRSLLSRKFRPKEWYVNRRLICHWSLDLLVRGVTALLRVNCQTLGLGGLSSNNSFL